MTSLVDRLYPLPDYRRTPLTLLTWWESRRPLYNGIVGTAGLVTVSWITLLSSIPPFPEALPIAAAAIAAVVYGLAANACYTLGWGLEMLARAVWGREAPDLGPVLLRQGLIFSVGLTLLPAFVFTFVWLLHLVTWMLG